MCLLALIFNLTQHAPTPEQTADGVVSLDQEAGGVPTGTDRQQQLRELLSFDEIPTREEVIARARLITELVRQAARRAEVGSAAYGVMLGGAPYLTSTLERILPLVLGCKVLYSFTRRESTEQTQPDGSVRKTNVFRHVGWVEM